MRIVFLGFNGMFVHKRGVENVIHFQSQACPSCVNYYLHWDTKNRVYKYENLICIGVNNFFLRFITLNVVLFKLKVRNKKIFIHSHNPLMSIMSIYQSNLYTVHDALYYLTSATKYKLSIIFWLLEKILYLRCSFVHFISDYAKTMSLFTSNKNFVIIPNTSHFENFKVNGFNQSSLRLRFQNDVVKVFVVRSIEERARIDLVIGVAQKLKNERIQFFVAGKGPLLEFYRNQIESLNLKNIILLGYVSDDDLIQYYKECDLVLIPAEYGEGFGLPIIEGYLFDKPVISSNVCAIPEVIISEDFLFENNIESIISKLYFALEKKQIQYRAYYENKFSNKLVVLKMNELYKKLM